MPPRARCRRTPTSTRPSSVTPRTTTTPTPTSAGARTSWAGSCRRSSKPAVAVDAAHHHLRRMGRLLRHRRPAALPGPRDEPGWRRDQPRPRARPDSVFRRSSCRRSPGGGASTTDGVRAQRDPQARRVAIRPPIPHAAGRGVEQHRRRARLPPAGREPPVIVVPPDPGPQPAAMSRVLTRDRGRRGRKHLGGPRSIRPASGMARRSVTRGRP